MTSEGLNAYPMATTSSPSEGTSAEAPDSSKIPGSPEPAQSAGSERKSSQLLSSSGLLGRLKNARTALDRGIDWAERRRQADRDYHLHWEPDPDDTAATTPATPPVSTTHVRVAPSLSFPETVTTRSSVMDSLPSWLVRGGLGSWLLLGIGIIISLVFFLTSKVVPVFIGMFLALIITSILQPLVSLFARVMPRFPATFLALLTALGVVAGLVTYVVTSVTNQWSTLAVRFTDGIHTIMDFLEHGPLPVHITQAEIMREIDDLMTKGQDYVTQNAPTLAGEVLSNAGTLVEVFTVLALALFVTIFFLASGGKMWRWFLNELPARYRQRVHRAAGAGWYTFAGYARGTVIVALTDAVMAGVFLQVVGIPLAAPLAVLVFIGAFIPIIGAPGAMVIAMIVALASKGVVTMIVVGVGVAAIGQIEGHILQPLIMGKQVSIHPVVVIVAVALGTFSAGLLGAIVAVPLVSVLWSVYSELHVRDTPVVGELPAYVADRG